MRYKHTYRILKNYGFSPMKAAEIVLDAIRGDSYAMLFIRLAFKQRA